MQKRFSFGAAVLCFLALGTVAPRLAAQDLRLERDRMKSMLNVVARDIEVNYYDPSLHGLDWKALNEQARDRVDKANSLGEMVTAVFSMVEKLNDSHTKFLPPERATKYLYGFKAKPIGDQVLVYEVKKDSVAAAAGLKVGDRLWKVNGFNAERNTFDLMMLFYRILRPTPELELVFSHGNEPPQTVRVVAKVKNESIMTDLTKIDNIYKLLNELESEKQEFGYKDYGDGVGYLFLPSFEADERFLSGLADKVKESRAIIVDVRNNPGGVIKFLDSFVGLFEPEPTLIFNMVGRKKTEPQEAKPHKPALRGPLFILVDSESSSSAEIFARHFQRTGKAVVIGDRTSGRVMTARFYPERLGTNTILPFGVQVSIGRVVFPDGEEIEKRGVTPDHICLPTSEILRDGRDPCLGLARRLARKALGLPEVPAEDKKIEKQTIKY